MGNKKKKEGTHKRAMAFEWPGDLTEHFCESYEEYFCLWDTDNALYYDKDKRQASLVAMGKAFKMNGRSQLLYI